MGKLLKYTNASIAKLINDINLIIKILDYTIAGGYLVYLILCLVFNFGYLIPNCILLLLTVLYLIFKIIFHAKKMNKNLFANFMKGYNAIKLLVKGYTLFLTFYVIITMPGEVSPLSTCVSVLLLIVWVFSLVLELIRIFIIYEYSYIENAVKTDIKNNIIIVNIFAGLAYYKVDPDELEIDERKNSKLEPIGLEILDRQKQKKINNKKRKKEFLAKEREITIQKAKNGFKFVIDKLTIKPNEKGLELIEKNIPEAQTILASQMDLDTLLEGVENKLKIIPEIGESLSNIPVLLQMIKCYITKEYTAFPFGTLVAIVATLLYLVASKDLIPDNIPIIGLKDDKWVVDACVTLIQSDLDDFKSWRDER